MNVIKLHLDYNKDNKINYEDIFDLVFDLMKEQKKNKLLSGADKKLNVLNLLKVAIGHEVFERYYPIIEKSIDFIHKHLIKSKCGKKIFCCF
jgi:hypothetical protein